MRDVFRKTIYFGVLCVSLLLTFQLQVNAQSAGSLSGRITDTKGAAVTGASVMLFLRETTGRVTTVTDEKGDYRFEHLATGYYIIEIVSPGFGRISKALRVETGRNTALDLQLEIVGPSETVLVTASGTPQTVDQVSKAVTVVGSQEIEQRDEYGIAEAVRTVPGLRIQQLGGPGTFVRIQMRGLRDFDTGVLIDGLRLRDVSSAQGDATGFIEELYTVSPDRLEVLRGSGSSLYGTNSIGGVVNILSDQGGGPFHGEVQLEGGSLGLFRGRTKLAGGLDSNRFVYSGGGALLNVTDGINDTPTRNISGQGFARYNFTPDISLSGRLYGNSAYLAQTDSPFAPPPGVVLPPTGSIVNAVALSLEQQRRFEAGLPVTSVGNANYISNLHDPDNRRDSSFFTLAFTFNHRVNDSFSYRASYQRVNTDRLFSDGPAGVRFEPLFNSFSVFDGRVDTLNLQGDARLGRYNLLTFGYEFEREQNIGENRDENPNPATRTNAGTVLEQRSNAFFIQNQFRAIDDRLQASAAFRVQAFDLKQPEFTGGTSVYSGQQFDSPKTAYTGDGSIAYLFRSSGTKLRAHAGSGYRAPGPFERFGSFFFLGVFSPFGDPRLAPERSIAVDGGIDQKLANDRVQLSATYFYTRLQQVIVFDFSGLINPVTDPFGRFGGYVNTGGGLARGVELSVNARPNRKLHFNASYTFTNAANRVATNVPGFLQTFVQPRHMFTATATQQITRRVDLVFDMFAYGSYYVPFSSRAFKFDGPVRADLGGSYTLPLNDTRSIRFYAKVENMFDREYFESGFRTPGAAFTGGALFRF